MTKLKVVNAFSSGDHQVLWLAGWAVYKKPGYEEIFETLDEAVKHCPVQLDSDEKLIEQWAGGYQLPADEDSPDWLKAFTC